MTCSLVVILIFIEALVEEETLIVRTAVHLFVSFVSSVILIDLLFMLVIEAIVFKLVH